MDQFDQDMQAEKANVELRKVMLRFNLITDDEDRYPLAKALFAAKVVVPLLQNEDDPDGLPFYGSMFKHANGVEFHVYTSVQFIPERITAPDVSYYPFVELMENILADSAVTMVRIDPGTDHGVGILIENGQPFLFRQKRVEDYMRERGIDFLE
ncbi:MAG: hypothetical protein IPJ76_09680 [Flavobacteriales bacterium]|nr:MAG: hypothetical protein IPJ76_09680 [Flavobacteriales bacterium]